MFEVQERQLGWRYKFGVLLVYRCIFSYVMVEYFQGVSVGGKQNVFKDVVLFRGERELQEWEKEERFGVLYFKWSKCVKKEKRLVILGSEY